LLRECGAGTAGAPAAEPGDGEAVRERGRGIQQPDDGHPCGDRAGAAGQAAGLDRDETGERGVLRREPAGRGDTGGARERHARVPPVHDPDRGRVRGGAGCLRDRAARGAPSGLRGVLPDAGAPVEDVPHGRGPAGDRDAGARGAVVARASEPLSERSGADRRGCEHCGASGGMSMLGRKKTLRAGLIGLGMMGRHHARNLANLDGVELVAAADPGGDPHGAVPDLEVLPDAAALIEAGIDYAVVAVPTQFHRDVALAFAEAGIHTLVEKPLAFDIGEAEEITAAFEQAGLVGAVGYVERYNPALQEMRRRIADGQLGEIYQIDTRRQGAFPDRIRDVGVVKDLATHDLDLTAWLAGAEFSRIAAHFTRRRGREDDDMVSIAGTLVDGTITNHLVNWLSPFKERTTVVTGEKGALVADTINADLTFHTNGRHQTNLWESMASFRGVSEGDVVRYALQRKEPLAAEHEAFRDAVLGEGRNIVTMREGLHTVRAVEAVLESARSGRVVSRPDAG